MRDFLIVLPFAYLVDTVLLWAAAVLFNAWYRHHDTPITDYLFQTLGACLLAFVIRALQQRNASLFFQSITRGRLLGNCIVATFAGFLCTFAYNEVVELTGSPVDLFYVGRPISMVAICIVLVAAYSITRIVSQSTETVEIVVPGPMARAVRDSHSLRHGTEGDDHKNDRIYLELAAIQSAVCVIDMVAHQSGLLSLFMFGILGAVLVVFILSNIGFSFRLKTREYYYNKSTHSSLTDSLKEM